MSSDEPDGPARRVVVLNGSLGGERGNTGAVLAALLTYLRPRCEVEVIQLATDGRTATELSPNLHGADAFVFATGTYWDSWGSPLQRFFEQATDMEGTDVWLGKPAAVLVTMHSVGGKGILSRVQGVLSTLGLLVPPMSGLVYSLASHIAMHDAPSDPELTDFWQLHDCEIIAHNLLEAAIGGRNWRAWPIDRGAADRLWIRPGATEQ
jgi:chromate reductase